MANTYPASGFACIDGVYSDVRVGGYPGSNDGALFMCITSNDYQAIRGYDGSTSTIHFFGRTWANCTLGNSSGTVNLEGVCGVTLGPWNTPQMVIRRSDGNVGIGTSSPTEGLVVSTGALRVTSQALNFSLGTRGISIDTTAGDVGRIYTVTGTGTATDLTFGTNNSERLRITTGGNVGIGTTTPQVALDIRGSSEGLHIYRDAGNAPDIRMSTSNGTNASPTIVSNGQLAGQIHFQTYDGSNYLSRTAIFGCVSGIPSSGNIPVDMIFFAGSTSRTERMRITSGGNVGIGATSVTTSRLRVEGATSENNSIADFISNDTTSPSTYHRGIRVLAPSLPTGDKILMSVGVADNTRNMGQLYFNYVGDQCTSNFLSLGLFAVDEVLNITGAGRVGIGTTSPSSKLDVNGADGRIQSRVDSSDGSTINVRPNAGKCGWISYTEDAVADRWGIGVKNGDAKLYFASGNVGSGGGTTRMVLDGSGNVGIGTASPNTMLQVAGNFTLSGGTRCILGDGGDLLIDTENVSGRDIILQSNSGQKVGVGTTSPSYRLHVNGTFYAAGSSQDYKQSICNYNTDSCMFMKLKPVTYQYKEEYCHLGKELKSGTQIGLIAEEVAESHPELAVLVNEEDNQVVRNVDYEKLSIILLAEVQKLRQEVDQLNQK